MGILMPYYLTDQHIYVPGTKHILNPQLFCLSVVKWKLDKYGSQDIIIIGIASLNIVQDRKAHIPFFYSSSILFFLQMGPLPALPFSTVQTNPMFSRADLRSGIGGVCRSRNNWR